MADNRWKDDARRGRDESGYRYGRPDYAPGNRQGQARYSQEHDRPGWRGPGDHFRGMSPNRDYNRDPRSEPRDRPFGPGGFRRGYGPAYPDDVDRDRYDLGYGGPFGGPYIGSFRRKSWRSDHDPDWRRRGADRDYGSSQEPDRSWWQRTQDEVWSWLGDDEAEHRRRMDIERLSHRGRGPRGYTRSDERIREDVSDRLTDDWHVDASDVEVLVSNGEVTLNGTIDSRQTKRRAEDIADSVSGVRHVQNNLRVRQSPTTEEPRGTGAARSTH